MRMRLTTLIPVLLAVLLLASSALFYMLQMQGSIRSIRRDSIAEMNRLITHLQNMLDSQLTQDNLQGAELSLSVTAMHPAVRSLILVDENDTVLLANRFVWRGKPADAVARYDRAIAARAHHSRIQDIGMDAHFIARGYYPITISVGTLNVGTGGGLSSRVGVLYVEMDFSSRYVTERQDALNATIGFVGSAFLVTLIITLLLHQRISRRVGLVMSATRKLMAGDPDVRVNLRGNDELAELGRDFDAMAESLQLQRQELVMKTHRLNDGQRIAQIGSWELDIVANQLVWSDEIFHIFEIDQASFGASYEAFLNAIHPDDRDAVNAAYMNSLADRKPYEITHRLRMTDGRIKWVYEHCESVFDDDDRPLRSTGTVQDITDRVLAQQESQRTRELLRSIIDTAPIRVFWKDLESRFLGCNTAFAKDAGESNPSDLVGKDDYQMAWKDQADIYRADDRKVMDSAVPRLSYEEPQTTPNGQIIWLRTSKVPLCNEQDGKVFGVLGIYEDITEHKQAEDELRRYRLHLEELVVERTIELNAAKDAAESANLAKSEFLSRMSHELRTPLNAILGFAQLMEMDALASEDNNTIENVHDVLSSGRHLLSLVNDILDFAQIEAGKLKAEPSKTNLLMIAIDGIGGVRHLAEERKIEVRLLNGLLEDLGDIWADPLRTKQVLLNLLSNAIKYNKAGGSIEVALETLNSGFIRLSVKDSGIGIPEENIGELFIPFSRLHTNTAFAEGAGIGLSITKDLVEMMGGRIGVKSVKGEGTTFWIDMPRYIEHAGAH